MISCEVAPSNNRVYFGLELGDNSNQPTANPIKCENLLNDVRICPRCNGKLNYTYRLYHHIGRATCENCGFPHLNQNTWQVTLILKIKL